MNRFDFCPWEFDGQATDTERAAQAAHQQRLADEGAEIGTGCYVSPEAAVLTDTLRLGARSYIAAHAYVTGEVTAGADCSVNPYGVVRGRVGLGDGVRIGAHTSLLGFAHGFAPQEPVHRQPLTSAGITVGDDVWIGSHVVVLDGVSIGDHCVIGAGAVVTKDLPAWSIAAGNPARPLRDRRLPRTQHAKAPKAAAPRAASADALTAFGNRARSQAADVISRCWDAGSRRFADRPGAPATVRAHCDAIEIADLLLGSAPPQLTPEEHVQRLRALQEQASGLVPEYAPDGGTRPLAEPAADGWIEDGAAEYHVLSVGYALRLLGSGLPHPVEVVRRTTPGTLVARLDALPWDGRAWSAGAWIDCWATGAAHNLAMDPDGRPAEQGAVEALFGWLATRVHPATGMWGPVPSTSEGRLQMVNGYYRLTRGSYARFGLPVPHAERVLDTVLAHGADPRWFAPGRENACNVLDVAHPLWLAGQQTPYRAAEARGWAEEQLSRALARWQDGAGFGFGPSGDDDSGPGREPGLQGTEMWLAIIWLLADLAGHSDRLGYRPRGVHHPSPARP